MGGKKDSVQKKKKKVTADGGGRDKGVWRK